MRFRRVGIEEPGLLLEGLTVCPGVAVGPVRFSGYELDRPIGKRIPSQRIEGEVDRFHHAVERSKTQVATLADSMGEDLGGEEARIVSVHQAYLEDATFLEDVEDKIRKEKLTLEGALSRVVQDFDRVFELVENEKLKEKALDLRDVALRVIRNIEDQERKMEEPVGNGPYILAVHRLSISDMLNLDRENVMGVIAEAGGSYSHPGIFARSMGIPTITGVPDLRKELSDGQVVILDAGTGVVHKNPSDRLKREYEVRAGESRKMTPFEENGPLVLADGTPIHLFGACGNLGEVTQAMEAGLEGIGLYRTELLFLVEPRVPGEELLTHHYGEVLARADGKRVVFRLLDESSDMKGPAFPHRREPNPALGLKGIRYLLQRTTIFRRQLRAFLRQNPGGTIELVVPFVTTVQDLQRVRSAIREERANLLKGGIPCADVARIGAMVEIPATAFHLAGVAVEADFLVISLDDLQQYLLAADRDSLEVSDYFRVFHPSLFRVLNGISKEARAMEKELILFGESANDPLRLPFLVGVGFTNIAVSPVRSMRVRKVLSGWRRADAERLAKRVLRAPTSLDCQKLLLEAEQ